MTAQRHVKLVRDGTHQSIQIPADLELPGEEALIRQVGDTLVIEPVPKRPTQTLAEWLKTIEPWDEEFPDVKEGQLPLKDVEL